MVDDFEDKTTLDNWSVTTTGLDVDAAIVPGRVEYVDDPIASGQGKVLSIVNPIGTFQASNSSMTYPLGDFSVVNAVSDTTLTLYDQADTSTPIATNVNWGDAANAADIAAASAAVGAFVLPADSKDSAILMVLQPGAYTAQASGTGSVAGDVLTEVYAVD